MKSYTVVFVTVLAFCVSYIYSSHSFDSEADTSDIVNPPETSAESIYNQMDLLSEKVTFPNALAQLFWVKSEVDNSVTFLRSLHPFYHDHVYYFYTEQDDCLFGLSLEGFGQSDTWFVYHSGPAIESGHILTDDQKRLKLFRCVPVPLVK